MFEYNKYDIMNSEEMKCMITMFRLTGRIFGLSLKYEMDSISEDEFFNEFSSCIYETLMSAKMVAHIGYENGKDLFSVDSLELREFMKNNNMNLKSFESDYSQTLNLYAKNLLLFMVAEEEDIDLKRIKDVEICDSITKGTSMGLVALIDKPLTALNPDNYAILVALVDSDFNVMDLDKKQIERLNEYHNKFMEKNISPKVEVDSFGSNDVLVRAKKMGEKRFTK